MKEVAQVTFNKRNLIGKDVEMFQFMMLEMTRGQFEASQR